MFKRIVLKLRKQPKAARDRVAFALAATFTGVVFMAWLYHAPAKLSDVFGGEEAGERPAPFSQVFDRVGDQLGAVKESVSELSAIAPTNTDPTESSLPQEIDAGTVQSTSSISIASSSVREPGTAVPHTAASSTLSVTATLPTTTATTEEPRVVRIITTSQPTSSTSSQPNN